MLKTKRCKKCLTRRPIDAFYAHKRMKDGHLNICKECHQADAKKRWRADLAGNRKASSEYQKGWRAANKDKVRISRKRYEDGNKDAVLLGKRVRRLRSYGLTLPEYEEMLSRQGGVCGSCGGPPDGRWKKLQIDHCHITGKVRGLLCVGCNRAAGYLDDSPEKASRLGSYLEKHRV